MRPVAVVAAATAAAILPRPATAPSPGLHCLSKSTPPHGLHAPYSTPLACINPPCSPRHTPHPLEVRILGVMRENVGGCACGGGGWRCPGMCWWGVSPRSPTPAPHAPHTPRPACGGTVWPGLRVMCGWGAWEGCGGVGVRAYWVCFGAAHHPRPAAHTPTPRPLLCACVCWCVRVCVCVASRQPHTLTDVLHHHHPPAPISPHIHTQLPPHTSPPMQTHPPSCHVAATLSLPPACIHSQTGSL